MDKGASKAKKASDYNLEDDEELWMKLQFIECLRDKNFEEAQEYLDDLLELYPENSQFMKDFQKVLPTEIEHQKKEIEAEALLEAEAEAEVEEEEEEDEKEGDQPSAEEEESEDEEEELSTQTIICLNYYSL